MAKKQTLADEVFMYRVKNNITQTALAQMCNCSSITIHLIENGKTTPSRFTEKKIRMVLDSNKLKED